MTNTQSDTYDPYLIDPNQHKAYIEAVQGGGNRPKVNWHNLPQGDATSIWRILPYPQAKDFVFSVRKHYGIPGMKGSLICPRSFDDPDVKGKKYFCAICDKFFEMKKSEDPAQKAITSLLRSSSNYLVNAVDIKNKEKGVGVLTLPYQVFQNLEAWIGMAGSPYLTFSHPKLGRNIIISSKTVSGSSVPGNSGKEKRDYTVMPDAQSEPIADMEWLNQLYDLKLVVGIPTTEFTQICLQRILMGDEKLELPNGVKAYRGQLGTGSESPAPSEGDSSFEPSTLESTPPPVNVSAAAASAETAAPAFVSAPITKTSDGLSEDEIRRKLDAIINGNK